MDEELKPCPFCGNNAIELVRFFYGKHIYAWRVFCSVENSGCGASSGSGNREDIINAWNRRVENEQAGSGRAD